MNQLECVNVEVTRAMIAPASAVVQRASAMSLPLMSYVGMGKPEGDE